MLKDGGLRVGDASFAADVLVGCGRQITDAAAEPKWRKLTVGCDSNARALCYTRSRGLCSETGCDTNAVARGLCSKHGGAPDCAGTTPPPPRHRWLPNTMLSGSDKMDTAVNPAALAFNDVFPKIKTEVDPRWDTKKSQATPNAASNVDLAGLAPPDSKASTHPPFPYLRLHPFVIRVQRKAEL